MKHTKIYQAVQYALSILSYPEQDRPSYIYHTRIYQ